MNWAWCLLPCSLCASVACQQSEAHGSAPTTPAVAAVAPSSAPSDARGDDEVARVNALEPVAATNAAAPPAPSTPFASNGYRQLSWKLQGPFGPEPVVVVVPNSADAEHRLPVLVLLHGRGESLKSPERGARGFVDDYRLLRALTRLESPPLTAADFGGMVKSDHLRELDDALRSRPYRGLVVVCPYLPDILRAENFFTEGKPLADFIAHTLLPKVYAETPALVGPEHTAIDGVSLGGRAALALVAYAPAAFGVAGATQPALDEKEIERIAALTARAREQNPELKLRLLTSNDDYFLSTTLQLSSALQRLGVEHQLDQVVGNHSYDFNRGPGVYEMLLFADRALQR